MAISDEPTSDTSTGKPPRRGFFFWSLAPILVLFMILMAILPEKRDPAAIIVLFTVEAAALALLLGLWNSERFWWAWRALGAIVFLTYVSYCVAMAIEGRFGPGRRAERTLFNAVLGLLFFGLPGLCYAVFGRLTWRRDTLGIDEEMFDEDDVDSEREFDSDAGDVDYPSKPL
jgi:hypothetical protein